jgi:hypothetical protein
MLEGLIWIVGIYAAGLAMIHWLHWRWRKNGEARTTHYVLMTRNNQHQVEWYIRSLHFFSWMKGRSIAVTVVDEGSTDETLEIVGRLADEYSFEMADETRWNWDEWVRLHEDEQAVVVRLSHNEGLETAFKYF